MIRRLALSGCSITSSSSSSSSRAANRLGCSSGAARKGQATATTRQRGLLSVTTAPATSVLALGKSTVMDARSLSLSSSKKYIHYCQVIQFHGGLQSQAQSQALPIAIATLPTSTSRAVLPSRRAFSTTKQTQVQIQSPDRESFTAATQNSSRDHVYIRATDIIDLIQAEKFKDAKEAVELYIQVNRNLKQPNQDNNQPKKLKIGKFKHLLKACLEVVKRYRPSQTMRHQQEPNDSIIIDPATGKQVRLAEIERTSTSPHTQTTQFEQTPDLAPLHEKAIQAAQLADFILQQHVQLYSDGRLDQPIPSWHFGMVILAHALSATPYTPRREQQSNNASRECRALEILHQLQDYYYHHLPATAQKDVKTFRPKPGDYNNVVLAMVNAGQLELAQDFIISFSLHSREDIATMSHDNNTNNSNNNKTIPWSALARRVLTIERPTLVGYQILWTAYRRRGNEQPHAANILLRDIIHTCVTVSDEAEPYRKRKQRYKSSKSNDKYKRTSYTEEEDPARVIAENIKAEFLPGLDRINYVLAIWCYSDTVTDQEAYQGVRNLYEYCFTELAKFGCIPDFYSYYLSLDTHARRGDADGAGQVFRELNYHVQQNPYSATPLSIEHVNVVLKAFARAYVDGNDPQGMEKARAILQDVRQRHAAGELNFGLDATSYNTLMHAHGERGQPRLATRLFDDLVQDYHASQKVNKALKPDELTFNFLLWAIVRDQSTNADRLAGERADYIINKQMPRFGVQPTYPSYVSLRKCWMKAKTAGHPEAERRLKELSAIVPSNKDSAGRKNEPSSMPSPTASSNQSNRKKKGKKN